MVKIIRPPGDKDLTRFLRLIFLRAERDIVNEITRKRLHEYVDYAEVAALDRVQFILQNMLDETWEYAPVMVEKIFYQTAKDLSGYANAKAQVTMQTSVVRRLADNLLGDIVEASATAMESVKDLFSIGSLQPGTIRNETLKRVASQQITGAGSARTGAKLAQDLQNHGITGFIDKTGRRWGLYDYCNMAVRTTARQAEVSAILTEDPEHDLYQILAVGSTCPVCAPLEGRIYSRSGRNPEYPALTAAYGKVDPGGADDLTNTYLNIHPNCVHPLVKYTTAGKTRDQIEADKDFSNFRKNPPDQDPRSEAQVAAYKKKVAARQKLLNDIKQFKQYQAILGEDMPKTFQTFQKHKIQKSDKYKKWQKAYREENRKIKTILAESKGGEEN